MIATLQWLGQTNNEQFNAIGNALHRYIISATSGKANKLLNTV